MHDLPGGEVMLRAVVHYRIFRVAPDRGRLPEAEEDGAQQQGKHAAHDVHQRAVNVVGPKELNAAEGEPGGHDTRPDPQRVPPAGHRPDQPQREDGGGDGHDAADHRAQIRFRKSRHSLQRPDGIAHSAERDRGRVGKQAHHRGFKRPEAEPDHHRSADRQRSSAAAGPLEHRSKRQGDQQCLQTPVVGYASNGGLDGLEVTAFHGQVVDKDGRHECPGNPDARVYESIADGGGDHRSGHVKTGQRQDGAADERPDRGAVRGHLPHGQQIEQQSDRQSGHQRG